jgi:phosphoribosylformylglycinamidine synthase PurS subunit
MESGSPQREPEVPGRVKVTVLVRPKRGILDPQGQAVEGSLRKLGFAVEQVRVGRLIDLEVEAGGVDDARAQVERMCTDLLANPLIEGYEIRLESA